MTYFLLHNLGVIYQKQFFSSPISRRFNGKCYLIFILSVHGGPIDTHSTFSIVIKTENKRPFMPIHSFTLKPLRQRQLLNVHILDLNLCVEVIFKFIFTRGMANNDQASPVFGLSNTQGICNIKIVEKMAAGKNNNPKNVIGYGI